MFLNQRGNSTQLWAAITAAVLKANRIEPELRPVPIALYVNMRWFGTVLGVEEEPIWTNTKDRRHPESRCSPYARASTSYESRLLE